MQEGHSDTPVSLKTGSKSHVKCAFPASRGCFVVAVELPSRVWLSVPWIIACQAPLSMEFSRQGYWSGLPSPSPGDLCDPGIKPWWILHYWATTGGPIILSIPQKFICWTNIKADCFGLFLWEVFLWGPISVRPRHADELKFVFLLLICLMSSLLLVQPQELKEGRGGNIPLPSSFILLLNWRLKRQAWV